MSVLTNGLFGSRTMMVMSRPCQVAEIGVTSQLAMCPETRMPAVVPSRMARTGSESIQSMRPLSSAAMRPKCGYSAATRPRLSHMARAMRSISGSGLSGNARRRLRRGAVRDRQGRAKGTAEKSTEVRGGVDGKQPHDPEQKHQPRGFEKISDPSHADSSIRLPGGRREYPVEHRLDGILIPPCERDGKYVDPRA